MFLAVLKAARSERASIMATYESTIVASLFAATYPDRTRSLILVDPQVTYLPTEEMPWMPSLARWEEQIRAVRDTWGTLDWWECPRRPGTRVVRPLRPELGHARWAGRRAHPLPAHGHPRRAPHDPGPDARARRQRSFLRGASRDGALRGRQDPGRPRRPAFEPRRSSLPLVLARRRDRRRGAAIPRRGREGGSVVRPHPGDGALHRHRRVDAARRRAGRPSLA